VAHPRFKRNVELQFLTAQQQQQRVKIASNTRSQGLKTPSPQRSKGTQADTIEKT